MKTQIKLLVLFCLLAMGATAFISFNLRSLGTLDNQTIYDSDYAFYSDYEENAVTVERVIDLMSEPWQQLVIIQGDSVVYRGSASDCNYNTSKVLEIANTEDSVDNSSITLIIE